LWLTFAHLSSIFRISLIISNCSFFVFDKLKVKEICMLQNKIRNFAFFSIALLIIPISLFAQKQISEFKQLGGSADEINQMRLPNPENLGTRSKVAMIPITRSESFEIPVDNTDNFKMALISPQCGKIDIHVGSVGDQMIDSRNDSAGISREVSDVAFDGANFPAEVFSFENLKSGFLNVRVNTEVTLSHSRKPIGFLVFSSDSAYNLYSFVDTLSTTIGSEIGVVTSLFDRNISNEIDLPQPLTGLITEASATITLPNGSVESGQMLETTDGVFRLAFIPRIAGKHIAQITARGTTPEGSSFIRTSEHLIEVSGRVGRIGKKISVDASDDLRFALNIPVSRLRNGQKVIIHGEIWGLNGDGREEAVSWLGGMNFVNRGTVSVSLDSRWLANSSVKGNYELRNIWLQDPDTFVIVAESKSIPLIGVFPTNVARNYAGEINDEMRQGKRPVNLELNKAVGGKLMLVHGYCSGDSWTSTAQFTNFVKFLDLNQNRTHDQFANLIRTFGASLPSFGIVAHSQGGAASLHLYTYYWSGLDNATGGTRLIQSVGTPYQGTALAGNLAVLGQIFGAGCGSNNDLTYSGAAAWLSGIPTWARSKVYYHTTSFTDVWWRYDYCSLATDLFLGDPEDGVVERAYAQLPGGNNMGHKTGWCHTTSMRDPGQTTDASRNSTMNSAASR
jgi:hypothetical protein